MLDVGQMGNLGSQCRACEILVSRRLESMQSRIPFLVFLLLGIPVGFAQTGADPAEEDDASVVAFVNVAVVSMKDEATLQGQTVVIRGERIVAIGPVETLSVPSNAMVIDGSDRYLIPGLADMHIHMKLPFANGPLYLDAGITTVLNLGTRANASTAAPEWQKVLDERALSRTPAFMGPTLYTVGPEVSGGETPNQVERIVRANAEGGYDFVKIHGDVSPDAFERIHETARRLGIKVTGHAQRNRGMQPVYANKQDLAHVVEYLYAAFNPNTAGFRTAANASELVLFLLLFLNVGWGVGALWRRVRKHTTSESLPSPRPVRRWVRVFTGVAWLFYIGLLLCVTAPWPGVLAGKTAAITMVGVLMLLVVAVAAALTLKVRRVWREDAGTIWKRAFLLLVIGLVWAFVVCSVYLTPRSWRTTQSAMARIARETKAAGIWVTPTLVVNDYMQRQMTDEFHTLIERPEMRYLSPAMRNRWINDNPFRSMSSVGWRNYVDLLTRLTGELHEANVPLLAGSDAGVPGVLPGSSLHEELSFLVQAGLTPYEALRTATVNAAIYLDAEQEFGRVAVGLRADLVLLTGNPLYYIAHTRSRVGVMRRGRWFPAGELEAALAELAEERK